MTVLCSGGTSSAKSGFGAVVAFDAGGIGALMNNIPTIWAVPFAAYLGLITYELATFCNTDPPAIPTITAGDVAALLTVSDPVSHLTALNKFQNLVAAFAWCQLCKCDSGAIPNCGTPPAAPASIPVVNPPAATGLPPTQAPSLCREVDQVLTTASSLTEITPRFQVPAGQFYEIFVNGYTPPSGSATFSGGIAFSAASTGAVAGYFTIGVANGSSGHLAGNNPTVSAQPWVSLVVDSSSISGNPALGDVKACFYAQPPTSPQLNCGCPPDPVISALLNNINELVTLLQRQGLPFAYQNGAVHSGVTGDGEISVSQLLGAKITPTTTPADAGVTLGDPDELWLSSWVTWGNADGWTPREWLRHSPQISLPAHAQLYTKFGYSLRPGLTVQIQELSREP